MFIIGLWIWIFIFVGIPLILLTGALGVMLFGLYKRVTNSSSVVKGHPKEKIKFNKDGTYDNTFVNA